MSDEMPERLRLARSGRLQNTYHVIPADVGPATEYVRADKCGPTREAVECEIERAIRETLLEVHRQNPIGGVVVKIDDILAAALNVLFPSGAKACTCVTCSGTGRVRSGPIPARAQGYLETACPACHPYPHAQSQTSETRAKDCNHTVEGGMTATRVALTSPLPRGSEEGSTTVTEALSEDVVPGPCPHFERRAACATCNYSEDWHPGWKPDAHRALIDELRMLASERRFGPYDIYLRAADALEAMARDNARLDELWSQTTHEAMRATDERDAAIARAEAAEATIARVNKESKWIRDLGNENLRYGIEDSLTLGHARVECADMIDRALAPEPAAARCEAIRYGAPIWERRCTRAPHDDDAHEWPE